MDQLISLERDFPLTSAISVLAPPLALAALLAAISAGIGRRLLPAGRADAESLALALPLGLGALGLASFGLLWLNLLRPWPLAIASAVAAAVAGPGLRELRRDVAALRATATSRRWWLGLSALAASASILCTLALYPPSDWDATIYHLPLADAFVEAGGFVFASHLRFPVFPVLAESLFAVLDLAGGDLAAQQLQALATLATAALVASWASARLTTVPGSGALAAALFLGSPIVVLFASTAYVDPLLSLFTTASLVALDRFRREGGRRWALLAGGLAGTTAAVKYHGLFFAAVVPLGILMASRGGDRQRSSRSVEVTAVALLAAALAMAPWYLRLVSLTGNPVFPFATGIFGPNDWIGDQSQSPPTSNVGRSDQVPSVERSSHYRVAAVPRLPFDLLFARARYNHQPPFSPLVLLLWPGLALAAWRWRWTRLWVVLLLAYLLSLCLVPLPAESRYLLPVYPLITVLLVAGVEVGLELARIPPRASRILVAAGAATLALGLPLYAGFHVLRQGPVPTGLGSRNEYLARHLPGFRAVQVANTRGRDETVYLLHAERLHHFVAAKGLGDVIGPAHYGLVEPLLGDPAALRLRLGELGADLLLLPRADAVLLPRDEAFTTRFRTIHLDDEVEVLELLAMPPGSAGSSGSPR